MRSRLLLYAFLCLTFTASLPLARAQGLTIEKVQIQGNQVVDEATYLFHISSKVGEPYDEAKALADFRTLWGTGFLADLKLDISDGESGKIVTFIVKERPRVRAVEFRGSKALNDTSIQEKLQKDEAEIKLESFYDAAQVVKAEKSIRALLVDKGRPDGEVKSEVSPIDATSVRVVFDIRDEQKVRIKSITFDGEERFSDWRLRWGLKKTRETWFFSFLTSGNVFSEEKFSEDLEKLRELYLNHGFVDVSFGTPERRFEDGHSRFLFWKRPRRWLHLNIPVSEGRQYRVGNVDVEGATVFTPDVVKSFFRLEPGEVYDESRIIKGLEKLRELYGSGGYVQFTGFPIKRPRTNQDVVDVTINLQEDKQYFVNRIEFDGNSTTRDKVIRREVWLNEQEVMNTELLKLSIRRINQLGYFRPIEQPDIKPVPGEDNKLDIELKVAEQNRNQFTFGGGVSGLEGTFINLSFSTSNFLGRGETATFLVQTGSRSQNFQVAITEPYFLDRPITLGFDVFKRTLRLPQFTRQDTGANLIFGLPVKRFSRVFLNYSYAVIKTSEPDPDIFNDPLSFLNPFLFDPSLTASLYFGALGDFTQSKITPTFVHNTTDQPLFPYKGVRYTFSNEFAGGPLGGTVNFVKPTVEGVWYLPVSRTTNFGFRVMWAWLNGYGGTPIPFFERFFLGGETQIRGYDIRTVGPREVGEDGILRLVGGDKMMLYNVEYYIPLAGPLRLVAYFDAGQAYAESEPWSFGMFRRLQTSTGAEVRFFVPVLNVPFRLIFAYNPWREDFFPATSFRFGIGTTF
jgi:outer membrane protein insertion porin family